MNLTGTWLTQLILAEQESLAATATARARQRVPLYAAWPPDQVQAIFIAASRVFAQTCATADLAPLRNYLKGVVVERLRAGASATDLLDVVDILSAVVAARVEQERAANPQRVTEALRLLRTYTATIRMILSEINLALINSAPLGAFARAR